jgi:hypothetical protein
MSEFVTMLIGDMVIRRNGVTPLAVRIIGGRRERINKFREFLSQLLDSLNNARSWKYLLKRFASTFDEALLTVFQRTRH